MYLKQIKFKNYKVYKDQEIDFDENRKLTVILGNHAVGKSVIIQGIEWALWGDASRENSSNTLINANTFELIEEKERATVSVFLRYSFDEVEFSIYRSVDFSKYQGKKLKSKNELLEVRFEDKVFKGITAQSVIDTYFSKKEWMKSLCNSFFSEQLLSNYRLFDFDNIILDEKFREKLIFDALLKEYEEYHEALLKEYEECHEQIDKLEKENYDIEQYLIRNRPLLELPERLMHIRKEQEEYRSRAIIIYKHYLERAFFIECENRMRMLDCDDIQYIPQIEPEVIDYIIKSGKCICGSTLGDDSECKRELLQLRKRISTKNVYGPIESLANYVDHEVGFNERIIREAEEIIDMLIELFDKEDYLIKELGSYDEIRLNDELKEYTYKRSINSDKIMISQKELRECREKLRRVEDMRASLSNGEMSIKEEDSILQREIIRYINNELHNSLPILEVVYDGKAYILNRNTEYQEDYGTREIELLCISILKLHRIFSDIHMPLILDDKKYGEDSSVMDRIVSEIKAQIDAGRQVILFGVDDVNVEDIEDVPCLKLQINNRNDIYSEIEVI